MGDRTVLLPAWLVEPLLYAVDAGECTVAEARRVVDDLAELVELGDRIIQEADQCRK